MPRPLRIRGRAGLPYLGAATEMMLTASGQDPYGVLYEAGDLQWWWRDDDWGNPANQIFWQDEARRDIALMLFHDAGDQRQIDLLRLPHETGRFEQEVVPEALRLLDGLMPDKPNTITVDERERVLIAGLRDIGYHPSGKAFRQMFRSAGAPRDRTLARGYRLVGNSRRPTGRPHALSRRNGRHVEARLQQCSLYRPDLDLTIYTGRNEPAAYCLCWLHPQNRVGLFEPVRTEDAHQGKGLGKALMREGLRRLQQRGARLVKISYQIGNVPAQRLYESVGFVGGFKKVVYVRG